MWTQDEINLCPIGESKKKKIISFLIQFWPIKLNMGFNPQINFCEN